MCILQVKLGQFKQILMPFCFGTNPDIQTAESFTGEHWMLLVADVDRHTVTTLNPKKNSRRYQRAADALNQSWM